MSNLSDLLKAITDSNSSAVGIAGDVIGTAADFSGAAGAVLQLIGLFAPKDDELQNLLQTIQSGFSQLQLQGSASDKLQRMRDIDQGINAAVGVFEQLPAIVASSPTPDFCLAQIQICVDAVLFFSDFDDKWQAVQTDLPYYSDSWNGELAPTPGADGLVFNYIYTLPQFLRSIYILLTTIAALQPATLSSYLDVLTKSLSRLESVHDAITSGGIVGTKLPTLSGWGDWMNVDADTGAITTFPYGAIEIYSGTSLVSSYLVDYFNYDDVDVKGLGSSALTFLELLQLRITAQMKALSIQIGLPAVWQAMVQLRRLTGQAASTAPLYEAWSFGEVTSLLKLTLPPPGFNNPVGAEPRGFEAALKAFLLATPPYVSFPVSGSDLTGGQGTKMQPAAPLPSGALYTFLTGVSVKPVSSGEPALVS
jgi:hypothetical protein